MIKNIIIDGVYFVCSDQAVKYFKTYCWLSEFQTITTTLKIVRNAI